MTALTPVQAVLRALRDNGGAAPNQATLGMLANLRRSEVADAVRSLRWRGFIHLDRLELVETQKRVNRAPARYRKPAVKPPSLRVTWPSVPETPAVDPPVIPAAARGGGSAVGRSPRTPITAPSWVEQAARAPKPAPQLVITPSGNWGNERQRLERIAATHHLVGTRTVARNQLAELDAREHRATDPVEQAKTYLQRRGFPVFAASVSGGPEGHYNVGSRPAPFTAAELVAFAEKRGFARAAA